MIGTVLLVDDMPVEFKYVCCGRVGTVRDVELYMELYMLCVRLYGALTCASSASTGMFLPSPAI